MVTNPHAFRPRFADGVVEDLQAWLLVQSQHLRLKDPMNQTIMNQRPKSRTRNLAPPITQASISNSRKSPKLLQTPEALAPNVEAAELAETSPELQLGQSPGLRMLALVRCPCALAGHSSGSGRVSRGRTR